MSKIGDVELTDRDRKAFAKAGREGIKSLKAWYKLLGNGSEKRGRKIHAQMRKAEGGNLGGPKRLYEPCPDRPATDKTPSRHRFVNGLCSCGQQKIERQRT